MTTTELIAKCRETISGLCSPRGTAGKLYWTMSIPAEPDRDPDLLWAECLDRLEKAEAENAILRTNSFDPPIQLDAGVEYVLFVRGVTDDARRYRFLTEGKRNIVVRDDQGSLLMDLGWSRTEISLDLDSLMEEQETERTAESADEK